MPAPIALFVYNRADLTRRTLEALAANGLAKRSDLIIFSDGPKSADDARKVESVREYVAGAKGFAQVRIISAARNQGLAHSIIGGVTRTVEEFGRAVIVEDDLETSPHFLAYMNDALDHYADTPRVAAINGYHPPIDVDLPETFFQRDAECWGWGTWERAWSQFDPDGARLLKQLESKRLLHFFDQDGTYPYTEMLKGQIAGTNSSWAVRWRAFVILHDMLSLYPGRPLTRNIGFDGSGTHLGVADFFGTAVSSAPVQVANIPLVHLVEAYEGFKKFNRRHFHEDIGAKLRRRLKRVFRFAGS
jgi:hypothetical protein